MHDPGQGTSLVSSPLLSPGWNNSSPRSKRSLYVCNRAAELAGAEHGAEAGFLGAFMRSVTLGMAAP
jgi:hypothetical protein